jgi:predicted ABC-type ATPase
MLERINFLLKNNETFAIETTLATKIYKHKLQAAIDNGYDIKLLFFWLPDVEMAIQRVAARVKNGGHNIPTEIIERRYIRGIKNLFEIYIALCDEWMVFDSSNNNIQMISTGKTIESVVIFNKEAWLTLKSIKNE